MFFSFLFQEIATKFTDTLKKRARGDAAAH
jgi:hypothetical protein